MKFYGQLEKAALESISSDPAQGVQGRFWLNSTSLKIGVDDGTNIRYLLRNDQNIVIGNNGTANNNLRLNRAGAGILQLVLGGDTTAEGSLSTSIGQFSFRHENFTTAGTPAAGAAGRVVWNTDNSTLFVDTGSAWIAVGSGGGGGALQWFDGDNAPVQSTNSAFVRQADFGAGLAQVTYCVVKVPNGYTGAQIKMRLPFISNDTSGNALLQTVATLIRSGTDAYTSTTNQRTSTNSAVSLGAGTQNKPQMVTFDLTDSTGKINSVSVSANDLIIVKLTRGTDTATGDVSAFLYGADVQFT